MEKCEHYWVIPNTSARTCQGVCRKCDASKEFLNRMPVSEDRRSHAQQTMWPALGLSFCPVPSNYEVLVKGDPSRGFSKENDTNF